MAGTIVSIDRVYEQTQAAAIALSKIGVEIHAAIREGRHDDGLTATVVTAHAKRAALAVTSIASFAGQLELLATVGGGVR